MVDEIKLAEAREVIGRKGEGYSRLKSVISTLSDVDFQRSLLQRERESLEAREAECDRMVTDGVKELDERLEAAKFVEPPVVVEEPPVVLIEEVRVNDP